MSRATAFAVVPDPAVQFIMRADSIAKSATEEALSDFVERNRILVGAAVGQLLDTAFQLDQSGESAAARENVDFARRVATIHFERSGSAVPLDLVKTYESWTAAQRRSRARAMAVEKEAAAARDAGELDKAVALFEEARGLYESIGDMRSIAVNYGSLGVVHWRRGDFDAVRANYKLALEARRAVEDRILEGKTLNGMGSVNYQTGSYGEAVEWYQQAIDLRRRTGDLGGLGTSYIYLGNAYSQLNQLIKARDVYGQAVDIIGQLGDAEQTFDLINGLASTYSDMGRTARAIESYQRAIAVAQEAQLGGREADARCNVAINYRRQARFQEALSELAAAERVLERNPDPERAAIVLHQRGLTKLAMGEFEDAREDLLAFLEISQQLANPTRQMDAYLDIGSLYRELGAFERGLDMAQKAKDAAVSAGQARYYRAALVLAADCQMRLGQYEDALASWKEARDQDAYDKVETMLLDDKVGIAMVRAGMGEADSARAEFYGVLSDVAASDNIALQSAVHLGVGHTFEAENPDSATAHYETALGLIEQAGTGVRGEEIRTGYLSGSRRYYYEEVARYYASRDALKPGAGWAERAFHTMERAKARGLANLMETAAARGTSEGEESVLDAVYSLDASRDDYREQRRALESRYVELRGSRVGHGLDRLAAASAIELSQLREALPKNTVVLEYALGDTTSLLWAVDRKGYDLYRIPARGDIVPRVERFRDAVKNPGAADAVVRTEARALYETLVAPAADRIAGARTLLIVPDGVLFELPFEALLVEDGGNRGWTSESFLARRFATVYAPSATIYLKLADPGRKTSYDLDLVAFGDPDFSTLGGAKDLRPLPYAAEEVRFISAQVDKKRMSVATGPDATERALKQALAASTPRILHLATHGLVDGLEPSLSSVVLGADPEHGEDGYLYTLEILALTGDKGLVVMSACESAGGKISRGEGVVGLSRAFIGSGASGVVASLWAVSDESTAALMKEFYKRMIGNKRSAGRALHEARLALIDDEKFAHPFYWAPFVMIGSDRAPW